VTTEKPALKDRTLPKVWAPAVQRDPGAVFLLYGGMKHTYGTPTEKIRKDELRREAAATLGSFYDTGTAATR